MHKIGQNKFVYDLSYDQQTFLEFRNVLPKEGGVIAIFEPCYNIA